MPLKTLCLVLTLALWGGVGAADDTFDRQFPGHVILITQSDPDQIHTLIAPTTASGDQRGAQAIL